MYALRERIDVMETTSTGKETTPKTNRREFLKKSLLTGAGAVIGTSVARSRSFARAIGASDRINIGLIGCGGRMGGLVRNVKGANANATVTAICDVWEQQRNSWTALIERMFGAKPQAYVDYRKLLESKEIDAVVIATPAHQHCGQVIDAARAGKHVYVEKPIAPLMESLEPLNKCYDAVKKTGIVIQHGTQGSSAQGTLAVKKFLAEGKLGKVFRIESTINHYVPYWNQYRGPEKEKDTHWKGFLYGKPYRPFDADQHAAWMGYHDFSSGPIGGWMSHFSNYVHAVTGCGCPVAATAFGGVYSPTSDRRRTAPDNVAVILEYAEGFYTHFVTHFGSSLNTETTFFMLEKGLVQTRFGHYPGNPIYSSKGVDNSIPERKLLEKDPPSPAPPHMSNWLGCIRDGSRPNADMEMGYKQGIAVIMGDTAFRLARKVFFDREKREIRPA
jgi:predicted dehydrogenase